MPDLYRQIGGAPSVTLLVERLQEALLNDPSLNHFFKNSNLETHSDQLEKYITYLLGGSDEYVGKSMYDMHAHLDITHEDFAKLAEHVRHILEDFGVETTLINMILTGISYIESDIVKRQTV